MDKDYNPPQVKGAMNRGVVGTCSYHRLKITKGEVREKDDRVTIKTTMGKYELWMADLDKGRNRFPVDRTTWSQAAKFSGMLLSNVPVFTT